MPIGYPWHLFFDTLNFRSESVGLALVWEVNTGMRSGRALFVLGLALLAAAAMAWFTVRTDSTQTEERQVGNSPSAPCSLDGKPYSEGALARDGAQLVRCEKGRWVNASTP